MIVKVFWQNQCPNCPPAKEIGKKLEADGVNVKYYDTKDVDGLSEAVFYDVLSTPSIIISNETGDEIISWRGEVPKIEEVKKCL